MSDDIVKRLLRTDGYDLTREEPIYVNPDGPKAADEIERLRAELAAEKERRSHYQRIAAELTDKLNGTPCAEIRWQQERDALRAELAAERLVAKDNLDWFNECNRDRAKMARDLIELDTKLAKAREALRPFAAFELWTDAYPDGPLGASTWDRHVNPEWISFARSVIEEIGEGACDTIGTLRAELDAANERSKANYERWVRDGEKLEAERDELRELLREARCYVDDDAHPLSIVAELLARIDAALKESKP